MKRTLISTIAILIAGVLPFLGATSLTSGADAPLKTGTIVGTFKLIGGPPPGENIPARGTVIFSPLTNDLAVSVRTVVNASGRFSLRLTAGRWTVTASSPQFNHSEPGACGTQHPITVKVGKRTSVAVLCEVP
jgi:hypothetical protein